MPFTIPNAANAEDVSQAQPDSVDFAILVAAFSGNGVLSGCAVSAQASPNMTVAVASGTVAVGGSQIAVTAGNVTLAAADPTNPRFSLIVANNAGALSAIPGTPAANPVFPAIPANSVVLAAVRVPAGATSINGPKITDKRVAAVMPAPTSFMPGFMAPWPTSVVPSGWLACDGSAVSRSTFANLFSVIGTTFGSGDNSTTFNLPDMQGRAPVGVAPGGHVDVNTIGKNEGVTQVNLRRMRHAHTVGLTLPNHVHTHALTLPAHGHVHTLSLPNHAHADNIAFADSGHNHTLTDNGHNHATSESPHGHGVTDPGHNHLLPFDQFNWRSGGYQDGTLPAGQGFSGGYRDQASGTGISINGATTGLTIQTHVTGVTLAGAVANITRSGGSVGNPTTNPTINGAVGNPTTNPPIDGTIGNATSAPPIDGTIGATGGSIDSGGYLVTNWMIKT